MNGKLNDLNSDKGYTEDNWKNIRTFICTGRYFNEERIDFCTHEFWSNHFFLEYPNANPTLFLEQNEFTAKIEVSEFMEASIKLYSPNKQYRFKVHFYKHYLGATKLIVDGGEAIC